MTQDSSSSGDRSGKLEAWPKLAPAKTLPCARKDCGPHRVNCTVR